MVAFLVNIRQHHQSFYKKNIKLLSCNLLNFMPKNYLYIYILYICLVYMGNAKTFFQWLYWKEHLQSCETQAVTKSKAREEIVNIKKYITRFLRMLLMALYIEITWNSLTRLSIQSFPAAPCVSTKKNTSLSSNVHRWNSCILVK